MEAHCLKIIKTRSHENYSTELFYVMQGSFKLVDALIIPIILFVELTLTLFIPGVCTLCTGHFYLIDISTVLSAQAWNFMTFNIFY